MSDRDEAAAALAGATMIGGDTPQAEALGDAVREHIANRPERKPKPVDPAIVEKLRGGASNA